MGSLLAKLRELCQNEVSTGTRLIQPGFQFEQNEASNPNRIFASNVIKTTKYTLLTFLPLNLWEQFHRYANVFFLFIVILNFMPEVAAFAREVAPIPVVVVLTLTGAKDAFEDYQRYKADKRVNSKKCRVYRRAQADFVEIESRCLWPGDIVKLVADDMIPADILLLHSSDSSGTCYVETGNLDGETNLKQRCVVAAVKHQARSSNNRATTRRGVGGQRSQFNCAAFTNSVEVELPNADVYRFQGKVITERGESSISQENLILRGCAIRNTEFVHGMVIYAGNETKASLNNQGPRFKRSKLESQMNYDIVWSIVILFVMCFMGAVGSGVWLSSFKNLYEVPFLSLTAEDLSSSAAMQAFINFWTYIIILQAVIPLSLYLTAEFAKLAWVTYINNDLELYDAENDVPAECKAWNIIEDLGQIEYVFCDKTGTLTENKMVLSRCSIGGIDFAMKASTEEDKEEEDEEQSKSNWLKPLTTLDNIPIDLLEPRIARLKLKTIPSQRSSSQPSPNITDQLLLDYFLVMSLCNSVLVSISNSSGEATDRDEISLDTVDAASSSRRRRRKSKSAKSAMQRLRTQEEQEENEDDGEVQVEVEAEEDSAFNSNCAFSDELLLKSYIAESPDEEALVKSACQLGFKLLHRSKRQCEIWLPAHGKVKLKLLHVLPFDSERKRMSILLRMPSTAGGELLLLTKGADNVILPRIRQSDLSDPLNREQQLLATTKVQLLYYARKGLRTLCFASRRLGEEEYADWLVEYRKAEVSMTNRQAGINRMADLLERQLSLVGATAIEDKLQDGVPDTLHSLRCAGMSVWVLTGDKQETAVQVAKTAKLLRPEQRLLRLNESGSRELCYQRVMQFLEELRKTQPDELQFRQRHLRPAVNESFALVIDGDTLRLCLNDDHNLHDDLHDKFRSLAERCGSVICSRTTPNQKAAIVRMVQKLGLRTLAIGDGANDVNMIQTADVGVGISGQEGMQATMAADFCLGRFRFLKRLLLVHGHWCYDRLARTALYLLYKNFMYSLLLYWYQVYNGFSGQAQIGQVYQIAFNLVMTSLTPLVMAVLDRHIKPEILMANPQLYADPRNSRSYLPWHFWYNVADAVWQSLVAFFVPYFVIAGSDCDMLTFGDLVAGAGVFTAILHNSLEVRSFLGLHWYALIGSPIVAWWLFALFLNSICVTCLHPDNPYYLVMHGMASIEFWLVQLLVPLLALMPRICVRALSNSLTDNLTVQAMRMQNLPEFDKSHKLPLKLPNGEGAENHSVQQQQMQPQQQQQQTKKLKQLEHEQQLQQQQQQEQRHAYRSTPQLQREPSAASAAAAAAVAAAELNEPFEGSTNSSRANKNKNNKHRRSKSTGCSEFPYDDNVSVLC